VTPAEMVQCLRDNYDEEILTADGFDDALIGVADRACQETVAAYDYVKCVEILMRTRDMSERRRRARVDEL
jgi:hypothetical protein